MNASGDFEREDHHGDYHNRYAKRGERHEKAVLKRVLLLGRCEPRR